MPRRRVLELGSGVGLTGLVVCRACRPSRYTFTDGHQSVLRVVEENVATNRWPSMPDVKVETLRWGQQLEEDHSGTDVVLGADLVFDPDLIEPLAATLADLLRHRGTAYIASTIRNADTYYTFQTALETAMLQWTVVLPPQNRVFVYDRSCKMEILRITRASSTTP
ncbi:protein-lysine N-methyltransferase EEF2KMT isoform X2 [Ixodes scapularis]